MRPQSAKAKGRRLQKEVVADILAAFPQLEPDDVTSRSMGAGGTDVLLSPAARRFFPHSVECKNVESINIWSAIEQSRKNVAPGTTPIVVFRKNSTDAYVALPWGEYVSLRQLAAREARDGAS